MTHHAVTILLYFINILNSIFSHMEFYDLTSIIAYNEYLYFKFICHNKLYI